MPVSQYITDLEAFKALVLCSADIVSFNDQNLTWILCPSAATALASCSCFKNQNSYAMSKGIARDILYPAPVAAPRPMNRRAPWRFLRLIVALVVLPLLLREERVRVSHHTRIEAGS
jgi:hypothetical protein